MTLIYFIGDDNALEVIENTIQIGLLSEGGQKNYIVVTRAKPIKDRDPYIVINLALVCLIEQTT